MAKTDGIAGFEKGGATEGQREARVRGRDGSTAAGVGAPGSRGVLAPERLSEDRHALGAEGGQNPENRVEGFLRGY